MQTERKTRVAFDPDAVLGIGRTHAAGQRCCAWPGCAGAGEYRAPRSPNDLRRFIWFCLEHIREYNRNWNYFAGMSEAQIEAHRRADTTWHRPSWRFGTAAAVDETERFHDPFGFFRGGEAGTAREEQRRATARALGKTGEMMAVLELEIGFTLEELKRRYKMLAKRHHPDLHGGDRAAEERLKQINEAYTYLIARQSYR